jgi:hypothetical protein
VKRTKVILATNETGKTHVELDGCMPGLLYAELVELADEWADFERGESGTRFDRWLPGRKGHNPIAVAVRRWLGTEGLKFFRKMKRDHGRVDAVYMEGRLPHPVHFREGMSVRNFMRRLHECKDWTSIELDDNWVGVVEEALRLKGAEG